MYTEETCQQLTQQCLLAIESTPLASALILGNLSLEDRNTHASISLKKLALQLSQDQINRLCHYVLTFPKHTKLLLGQSTSDSLQAMLSLCVTHADFAKQLNRDHLVAIARQDQALVRWVIFDLMVQANPQQDFHLVPPLLRASYPSQSAAFIAKQYRTAHHLPVEPLYDLCNSRYNAALVIQAISQHPRRYALTEAIVETWPSLAKRVADKWRKLIQTVPLRPQEHLILKNTARRLAQKYPVFKPVLTQTRTRRVPKPSNHLRKRENIRYIQFKAAWTVFNLVRLCSLREALALALRGLATSPSFASVGMLGISTLIPWVAPILLYKGYLMLHQNTSTPIKASKNINKESKSLRHTTSQISC